MRCRAARDDDADAGNFEFSLVEDHGVSAWFHRWRGESAARRGIDPVLRGTVEPVDNNLVLAAVDARSSARYAGLA